MKKKIYSVLFLTVAALLMCACDDKFLDKTPLDKLTEDAVFNSVGLAENHVNSMYSVLPDFLQEGNIGAISDEGYFRYGGTSTRYIAAGTMDPDNIVYMQEGGAAHNNRTTVLNIWNRSYKYLRDMNYLIDRVEEGSKMDVADRNRLLGEVYFLRAWTYTNMIERYAGVPLIKHTYKMSDEFGVKRNDFDYCVDEILKDLDKADSLLGPTNGQGRANRVVSKALRSRLTLIAASPLFNDPDNPSGGIFRGAYSKDKWTRAFNAAKEAIEIAESQGYRLADTYDEIWKDVNCPENIWCKFFTPLGYTVHKGQLLYPPEHYSGWSSLEPTQAMVSDYEMLSGKKWFEEGSGYDANHPYKNRDPRFYYCIAAPFYPYGSTDKNGTYSESPLLLYYLYDGMTRKDFEAGTSEPAYTSKAKHTTSGNHGGLELYKWYLPTEYISESQTGSKLYPWFRLAEMYLNYAEAAYMLGREDICREYINKIRQRPDVMMPEVTESGSDLWDRLVNERRVELYAEMFRYFDLRRWKLADLYENVPLASAKTMVLQNGTQMDTIYRVARLYDPAKNNTNYYWANTEPSKSYVYSGYKGDPRYGKPIEYIITYKWLGKEYTIDYGDCILNQNPTPRYFPEDGRNYLMPIPRNEITKSEGKLLQNPGYPGSE